MNSLFCHICGNLIDFCDVEDQKHTCKTCGRVKKFTEQGNFLLLISDLKNNFHVTEILYKKEIIQTQKGDEDLSSLPTIDEICPKCGHNEMAFTTQQLRSADEGQTVFYTCVKCKYKFTQNN